MEVARRLSGNRLSCQKTLKNSGPLLPQKKKNNNSTPHAKRALGWETTGSRWREAQNTAIRQLAVPPQSVSLSNCLQRQNGSEAQIRLSERLQLTRSGDVH